MARGFVAEKVPVLKQDMLCSTWLLRCAAVFMTNWAAAFKVKQHACMSNVTKHVKFGAEDRQ